MEGENQPTLIYLSIVKQVKEVASDRTTNGCQLVLAKKDGKIFIQWIRIVQNGKESKLKTFKAACGKESTEWAYGNTINLSFDQFAKIKIDPMTLSITFYIQNDENPREFQVSPNSTSSFTGFIANLLMSGIVYPKYENEWYFQINTAINSKFINSVKPNLILELNYQDMDKFWYSIIEFYMKVMKFIGKNHKTLLQCFPSNYCCDTYMTYAYKKSDEFNSAKRTNILSLNEILGSYDGHGVLFNLHNLKSQLYFNGIDFDAISEILPFLINMYPEESTREEREKIEEKLKTDYDRLLEISSLQDENQMKNNKNTVCSQRVLQHDVIRTDRQHPAFKDQNGIGLSMLTRVLTACELLNKNLGYVQGMNDMFVPFVNLYIPNWDANGIPRDSEGNEIDVRKIEYKLFWLYMYFLEFLDHDKFLEKVSESCKLMATNVMNLLRKLAQPVTLWLEANNFTELMWCISDFVMLFKRSIQDIWPVWMRMLCAPDPNEWFLLFICGTVVEMSVFMSKQQRIIITTVLTSFPTFIATIDPIKVAELANYLMHVLPPKEKKQKREELEFHSDFFSVLN